MGAGLYYEIKTYEDGTIIVCFEYLIFIYLVLFLYIYVYWNWFLLLYCLLFIDSFVIYNLYMCV